MPVSIVPSPETEDAIYQVLDDLGKYGHVWAELAEDEANEETVIQRIMEGQFKPVRVIASNPKQGWSRDVTHQIAWKILGLNHRGVHLGEAAREFVERETGESPIVTV